MYLGKTKELTSTNNVKKYEFDENKTNYKFIKVSPSDFDFNSAHDYFILIENTGENSTSFNISVIENSLKMAVENGVRKVIRLGAEEGAEFFK